MKYLVVNEKYNDYFFPYVKNECIDIKGAYIIKNKFDEFYMKLLRKLNLNFTKFLTTRNLSHEYDCIVFFDCSCDYKNLPYLKGDNKDVRLFIWNLVDDFLGRLKKSDISIDIDYVKKSFDCVYSFDKNDCEKFGLEYYPQVYTSDLSINETDYDYDVVFLGAEKGRYDILKGVYDEIHACGFKQLYHIFKEDSPVVDANEFTLTSKRVNYNDYLKWVAKSKAIIDIAQTGQVGFTLRVMESIFFRKKLITTCREIRKYKLYDSRNVFIIGEDDYSKLDTFLSTEYVPLSDDILSYYDIKSWLNNMKNNVLIENGI